MRLRSFKHSDLRNIAAASKVPEGTVRKLYYGEVENPRIRTIEALHNYFNVLQAQSGKDRTHV